MRRVPSEIEFGQISVHVFRAYVMEDADNASLQEREVRFREVDMHIAAHILAAAMANRLMCRELAVETDIGPEGVGVDPRLSFEVLPDECL